MTLRKRYHKGTSMGFSDNVATFFYGAGLLTSIGTISYRIGASNPSTRIQNSGISATFLMSVIGGTLRTWCNPQTSWPEKMLSTTAVILLSAALVANALGEQDTAFFATTTAGGGIGFWNTAMMHRVYKNEQHSALAHAR